MTRVLVTDDERVIRELICEILERAGYTATSAETAEQALDLLADGDFALVVSDILMPGLSGLELLDEVRVRRPSLPVVLVTGAGTYENLSEAVARGADGLVIKPFSHADLEKAVARALERSRRAEADVRRYVLAPALAAALGNAIEARDMALYGHCERLGDLAVAIAERLALPPAEIDQIRLGASLHDVGKVGVPDRLLLKDGCLAPEEVAAVRRHPEIGERLLAPLESLHDVAAIVRHHHERWDGQGYPDRLAREAIPRSARIVAVADAVEAMSAPRPYREPLAASAIVCELRQGSGSQWDPEVVDVVLSMIEDAELVVTSDGLRIDVPSRRSANAPRSVLLVDDDPDQALLATESIEAVSEAVRVVHAPDMRSATDLCRGSRWALAVVDHNLPDGSGLDLLRTIKAASPALPVVMLTGEGSEAVAVEAFRRGASEYVVKTTGYLDELAERVRPFLEDAA